MLRKTLLQFQLSRRDHRIVVPASLTTIPSKSSRKSGELRDLKPSVELANFIGNGGAQELKSRVKLNEFSGAVNRQNETIWKDSRSHLRRQEALVEKFGIEGAVRETLQPTGVSFTKELNSRPLDRKILEEIYRGLHGRRVERKLKRGVNWEHWIAKGDGTAPVYNTSQKAQQMFGYGGKLEKIASASHEKQFPSSNPQNRGRRYHRGGAIKETSSSTSAAPFASGQIPEVAFIGRTNSGKSSLINALLNSFICPYGHLQGTTKTCDFYSVAGRLTLVDLPGYGYYNPLSTSQLDAENAIRVMKQFLNECSQLDNNDNPSAVEGKNATSSSSFHHHHHHHRRHSLEKRNIKRVFVCISSRGMQHLDIQYLELLEKNNIPFSVVLTKTDRAPIRFLARLADFTRCQLVHYKNCKELFLVSSLRLAGVDKLQELIAGVSLVKKFDDDSVSMSFDQIV
ncbi:50S ribosome-bindign GTPase, putative [Bodo saltans]|uniref:50S ribosome-bindign GTPase, putative n=1 Tax=Bodo saltans TaxID=75058 RepID=A0A0S4IVC3_BODSA|nr:50S ribosome-bindign GTPase, putative [Bodo saltans]|eukprot:CUF99194.1 50S ribosome-bindign GTPase, putative [Bodo saltans]